MSAYRLFVVCHALDKKAPLLMRLCKRREIMLSINFKLDIYPRYMYGRTYKKAHPI